MKISTLSVLALALASTGLTSLPAVAQDDLQRGETVLERRRPELEQLGIRAGSFRFLPRLEAGAIYDTNVFASDANKQDDIIWTVQPRLDIRSDFSAHALNFSASANAGRYQDYSSENYTDYAFQADGRYDVSKSGAADATLYHRRNHEGRGDIDSLSGYVEPVTYTQSGGEVGYTQRFNRLRARLSGTAQYSEYDDVGIRSGGIARQGDRDRWEYAGTGRVGYEFIEGYETFVQGTYSWTRHRRDRDFNNVNRDSDGYEIVGGVTGELTGLITGELYAGYLARNYEDSRLKDFGGLALGGRVNWSVTQLTSITGSLSRQIRETSSSLGLGTASSYERTIVAVGVDHELLRTLLLNARAQYRRDDFNGNSRKDDIYTAGAGATYQFSRNLFLTGGYTYEKRNSDVTNIGYTDNLVYLRLGAQM
ncbi:outer membrane beta-barrel protein [Azospirillum doebereinerae]|uniref:outer membrane beta-barrel protein n=1 Tax=Azospirillum doebereinerae TaxID=92933 RepID=UPI001EE56EB2|nr:outer membrane beta-barrel protein [Azospirillum doebereinerae]MCG5243570.1 outer membrane beta-barrel protein [Azospirillum doebereinerae]